VRNRVRRKEREGEGRRRKDVAGLNGKQMIIYKLDGGEEG